MVAAKQSPSSSPRTIHHTRRLFFPENRFSDDSSLLCRRKRYKYALVSLSRLLNKCKRPFLVSAFLSAKYFPSTPFCLERMMVNLRNHLDLVEYRLDQRKVGFQGSLSISAFLGESKKWLEIIRDIISQYRQYRV